MANGVSNFQSYHQVVMYLFKSLAKSWTRYFENTVKLLAEVIVLSEHIISNH